MDTLPKEKAPQSKFMKAARIVLIIVCAVLLIKAVLPFAKPVIKSNLTPEQIYQKGLAEAQSKYPGLNSGEFQSGYEKGIAEGSTDSNPSVIINDPIDSYKYGFSMGYSVECVKKHSNDMSICQNRLLGQ